MSSILMDTSQDRSFFGSALLVAELQEASDEIEEMESRVQVKLMVGEAVLKGMLTALERDAAEVVETKEAELRKAKEKLQEKDSIVNRLIISLQKKEEELVKLVEESNCKEHRVMMDMVIERERVSAKVKESEKFVASKEKELSKMAECMVELAMNLDGESKKAIDLEKLLKESKECEFSKGRKTMSMTEEKTEEFRSQKDPLVEIVRRELKELCFTNSMVEKDKLLSDQLQRITILESAEKELWEEVQVQSGEINRLVQSGKDSSELLKKITIEKKNAEYGLVARERSLKSLQADMDLLNDRIQELLTEKSILVDELSSRKAVLEAQGTQLAKQNDALQDTESRIQTVSLSEQHLRQETTVMSASLQEYMEATQSLKMEMEDQNWKYEFQTGLIMETLKGKVVELAEELNLLGHDLGGKKGEKITFETKVSQESYAELNSLQSSQLASEEKFKKFNVAMESDKQSMKDKDKILGDKVQILRQAENVIFHPEEQVTEKELLQNHKNEVEEIKCHEESMKKLQKLLEENVQMLREAENRICFLDQEVAVKDGLLQNYKNEMEEQSWTFEFEGKFISTYVENSFQEFLRQLVGIQGNLVNVGEKLISGQNDLEAARDDLWRSTSHVENLKLDLVTSSMPVGELQMELKSCVGEYIQATVDPQDAYSDSERQKTNFNEDQKEMNCLRKQLEELVSKKREEAVDLLEKLEESEWKSQAQCVVILGLVEGSTQEWTQEFSQLRDELKLKHQEVLSLRTEVAEQNQRLTSFVSEVRDLKISLASKDEELLAFRQGTRLTRATQQDALVQEQIIASGALKEIENLKKLKMSLVARMDEEKEKVQQLEEALAEQKWKDQVELDIISTIFWEGGVGITALWNTERALLLGEAPMHEELGKQKKLRAEEETLHHRVQHGSDSGFVESCVVPRQGKFKLTRKEHQDSVEMSPVEPDPVTVLVRQNSELRREKEQLLEQKTDEIYRLKREFYRELEKVKRERKSDAELKNLKRESSGLMYEVEAALLENENVKSALMERKLLDDQSRDSEFRLGWDYEKSSLLESISQKDEHIKARDEQLREFSMRLSYALEKERNHVSSRASLVENLAALEKERNRLNSVHEMEKENLVAYYKKVLEEKETKLNSAIKDIEERNKHKAVLENESGHVKDGISVLRNEMMTVQRHLEIDLIGKIQVLVASSQQLENDFAQRMTQYNHRLEGAQNLLEHLPQHSGMLLLSDADLENVHNLQKAEAEVDMLGDEVDALMDILEKVYNVLNHYAPIIQHYPGLAELVKVVRQEVLQRICESKEG